jgi:hypothetical protein
MFQILLAAPSIIYAPIYIAKELCLSKWFAHTEIRYPETSNIVGDDQLINDLLRTGGEPRAILAVADPMRILFSGEHSEFNDYDTPKVLGSLVNKKLVWGINFPNRNIINDTKEYKIISYPEGMSLYTIVFNALYENFYHGASPDLRKNETINSYLFDDIKPGEERYWSDYFKRWENKFWSRKREISYITMDPMEWLLETRNGKRKPVHLFSNEEEILFTGLITGKDIYENHQDLIDDLLMGIKRGIKYIQDNPVLSRDILTEYHDNKFNLSNAGWSKEDIYYFVKTILVGQKAYKPDLKITDVELENSIKEWKDFFERRICQKPQYQKYLQKLNEPGFKDYFDTTNNNQEAEVSSDFYKTKRELGKGKHKTSEKVFLYFERKGYQASIILISVWSVIAFINYLTPYKLFCESHETTGATITVNPDSKVEVLMKLTPTSVPNPMFLIDSDTINFAFGVGIAISLLILILKILINQKGLTRRQVVFSVIFFIIAVRHIVEFLTNHRFVSDKLYGDIIGGIGVTLAITAIGYLKDEDITLSNLLNAASRKLRMMRKFFSKCCFKH